MDFTTMQYDEIIGYFRAKLPSFPDGRIDYHGSKENFVLDIWVKCGEEILLLKRSDKVRAYKGKRDCIWGYIDEEKPAEQKIREEIHEELSIPPEKIQHIHLGEIYVMHDAETDMDWIWYPVIAELDEKLEITLDYENTEYQWVKPVDIKNFDIVPELEICYANANL